jgi:antitoxin HicB
MNFNRRAVCNSFYPATIEADGTGNLLVTFRDIPFAATEGTTIDEALTEARDCLETAIASCIKDKEDIPNPIRGSERSIPH